MDEEDLEVVDFLPVAAFKFSLLATVIDMADALLENLKAHHNHRINRSDFHEQAAREIESITQEG